MEWDVEKVVQANERMAGIIERQRKQLEGQQTEISSLRRLNEKHRETIGVLRFRLMAKGQDGEDNPVRYVISRHGWNDDHAAYRTITMRIPHDRVGDDDEAR